MDFEKICETRYSVRNFDTRKVEEEKIEKLLKMARLAPTAVNNQPYEIYVANTEEGLNAIKKSKDNLFGAPLCFVICSDKNKEWCNRFSGKSELLQDIGIITTTLMYGATELGLGSCYVCAFNPMELKSALSLPDNLEAESLLLVGYPSKDCEPSSRHGERRDFWEFVHRL